MSTGFRYWLRSPQMLTGVRCCLCPPQTLTGVRCYLCPPQTLDGCPILSLFSTDVDAGGSARAGRHRCSDGAGVASAARRRCRRSRRGGLVQTVPADTADDGNEAAAGVPGPAARAAQKQAAQQKPARTQRQSEHKKIPLNSSAVTW